ncbi:MAG: hypothetical protein J5367_07395 [Lachnospiraceae bacterium]|nr:hypothetical protein [Lachnospiraceae bacterium]
MDRVFIFPEQTDSRYAMAVTDYRICMVIAAILLIVFIYGVISLIFLRNEYHNRLLGVIKCALPYLPVIIAVLCIKLPQGFLTNDEYSIYYDATNLIHDTWFNYMTVYFYIVSLIIFPFTYGPIIMKVIIEFFVVGYCVYRSQGFFGKRVGSLMYILFLLYPVIAYTTSAHRLPVYFLIYLALFVKIIFDRLEKRDITFVQAVLVLFSGAVLTQWRTEGIYLLVLVPILMFMAYPGLRKVKSALFVIAGYLIIQYVLWIPQNGISANGLDSAANDRMKPFYAYTITNMYRNGLDTKANAADLEIVDRYLSVDVIEKINEHYGDINYEDVLILYKDGFIGVRPEAGDKEFAAYSEALGRIFVNNPGVFAATRWGAFCYAALPYHIEFSGTGLRELASFAISIVKTTAYNLFIPVTFMMAALVYCLIKRDWFDLFVFGGLAAHWFIVLVLAPASYFKYYFPVYIISYFYMIFVLMRYLAKNKEKTAS